MTIGGALSELDNLLKADDIPCYYKPSIKAVMDTIALEQESRKDEVILTNKEYRELIANEYDNGYCKGYTVALEEQEAILNRLRTEIRAYYTECERMQMSNFTPNIIKQKITDIFDKYKAESDG